MKTIAKQAFDDFKAAQLGADYSFEKLTADQQLKEMKEYTRLKLAAQREEKENQEANGLIDEYYQADSGAALTGYFRSISFKVDNSEADWDKLFNNREIYGDNWKAQADYHRALSAGASHFMNVARSLLNIGSIPVQPLEVVYAEKPVFDEATEKLTYTWERNGSQLLQVWQKISKSANQIALNGWLYEEFSLRIVAPIQLTKSQPGIKAWFDVNNLPLVKVGEMVHLYCNEILPEDQVLVDSLNGIITVETKPV